MYKICLPNLLAGGLPAGALPGLALACAANKRAQHTRTIYKGQRAQHTRATDAYTGEDMKEAIEMRGRRGAAPASLLLL